MWKLSHVGILKYEHADRLARSAYAKPSVDTDLEMPFAMTSREQSSCKGNLTNRMNIKGPKVVTYYNMLSQRKLSFVHTRCDVFMAVTRHGYWLFWQVGETCKVEETYRTF